MPTPKPTTFNIRDAKPEDISQVFEMIKLLAEAEKKEIHSFPLTEDSLAKYFQTSPPSFHLKVAAIEQRLVGYALYFYTFRPSEGKPLLYIEDLYVRPSFRNQGIGTQLMASLAEQTLRSECAHMEWNVFNWNEKAIAFYDKIGAKNRYELHPVVLKDTFLKDLAEQHRGGLYEIPDMMSSRALLLSQSD